MADILSSLNTVASGASSTVINKVNTPTSAMVKTTPKQSQPASETIQTSAEDEDWRVRLHLSENVDTANYLYNAQDPGILAPLRETNGLIFPYTPEISVQYIAEYASYNLRHSNYRGYFYSNSATHNLVVSAPFTVSDIHEANYLLAAMHFLRSASKMFYGQDERSGTPPPLLFLSGLGEYQFNNHPCVVTGFAYSLPAETEYVACGTPSSGVAPVYKSFDTPKQARMKAAKIAPGAEKKVSKSGKTGEVVQSEDVFKYYNGKTYVPTEISLAITLLPIQTREQVSSEFSLRDYASGKLLKKGFW